MTMLVATLGLLPAALSHAIGSDSQRPFAIVIVGGLLANLVIGIFLLPTLYVWVARENDGAGWGCAVLLYSAVCRAHCPRRADRVLR
jgi:hypothetical protein